MGNSECVTRQSNSLNLEHRMTHSPQKSYAEDDVGLEVSDERMKIVTMKQFKYQSLSAVKQNQTRHAIEVKTRHDSYSNNELISKKTKETKDNPIVKLESLKPLKIDPMIFINIKKGKVTENYQMDKLLGEGTYGRVMLVTHKSTDLRRALKIIKRENVKKNDVNELLGEFEILKTMDHPNIVRMYEMYSDEKSFYLISEYCEGGELFDRIKKVKSFSESMAANIMYQILSAVVYCHSKNIVHRDLKPENILFASRSNEDQIKLIDFGVSSSFTKDSKMHEKQGTAYYIAPEVLRKNYDEKCDIWSCGVILYILLCGYPPFNGSSDSVILSKISKGEFTFRDKEWKSMSANVKDLISQMLTFEPEVRPSGNELLNHEWFNLRNQDSKILHTDVIQRLNNFHIKCKLQHAIMTYIVTQIEKGNELKELLNYFTEIDKDKNGVIAREELIDEFIKQKVWVDPSAAEVEIDKILKYIDANMSGQVDFTEFVLATIERDKLLSAENVRNCFKMFDKDSDGFLSKEELKDVMEGLDADEDRWNVLLKKIDINSDGKISLEEFMAYLQTADGI